MYSYVVQKTFKRKRKIVRCNMACCYNLTRSFVLFFLLLGLIAVVLSGLIDFWWTGYEDGGITIKADKGIRTSGLFKP